MHFDLFSDRFRFLKVFIALLITICCCIYSHSIGQGMESMVFLPVTRGADNGLRVLSYFKVLEVEPSGIVVHDKNVRILAKGKFDNVKIGDTISIVGVREDNALKMERYHIHRGRFLKKALSLLAFLILAAISLRYFSFDRKTFSIIEREPLT